MHYSNVRFYCRAYQGILTERKLHIIFICNIFYNLFCSKTLFCFEGIENTGSCRNNCNFIKLCGFVYISL